MNDVAEFDPSDHPGEIVYQLRAICANQDSEQCPEMSEAYLHTNIFEPAVGEARADFERSLESDGWVYGTLGWICPPCAAIAPSEDDEEDA